MGEGQGEGAEAEARGWLNRPGNKHALTGEAGDLNSLNLDTSPGSAFPLKLFVPQSPHLSSVGRVGERMRGGRGQEHDRLPVSWGSREDEVRM